MATSPAVSKRDSTKVKGGTLLSAILGRKSFEEGYIA